MGTWNNNDTLFQKFGTDIGTSISTGGEYCTYGPDRLIEIELLLTDLTETETIQNDNIIIPASCQIMAVETVAEVAAATGVAIDVGTIHTSRNTSDSEYTAVPQSILAAFATASMDAVGERVMFYGADSVATTLPASVATGGAIIGTVTVAPMHITASRTTATAFTAGRVKLRIWVAPRATSDN